MTTMPHPAATIEPAALTDADRWRAFAARDRRYDGVFVVAVRSTGIFCRPSCPARRPRPENVTFYPSNEAASQAGYRPCRRCRPDEVDSQVSMVRQVCAYIEAHLDESPTLGEIGAAVAVSPYHLQRVFKRIMGVSPRQYADALRRERLKAGLKAGREVTRAIYDAGYASPSGLAPDALGMTPTIYRRGGAGQRIGYAVAPCALGYVLVAATERGICAVYLGDAPDVLENILREEFSAADLHEDTETLGAWIQALLRHLEGGQPALDLPLDVQATALQRRVWEALRAIPPGSTRTYGEIARLIGDPKAARAVGHACATNPAAVVIPCHRAVRGDGGLGGYRWGLERKRALLDRERAGAKPD